MRNSQVYRLDLASNLARFCITLTNVSCTKSAASSRVVHDAQHRRVKPILVAMHQRFHGDPMTAPKLGQQLPVLVVGARLRRIILGGQWLSHRSVSFDAGARE